MTGQATPWPDADDDRRVERERLEREYLELADSHSTAANDLLRVLREIREVMTKRAGI